MSHVDEGTLHAYIDGELPPAEAQGVTEHLAHCPVCRGQVEEERALIARADQVLALARPPERDVPAFRTSAPEPPVRWWWQFRVPLAWAATVVLALGIGLALGSEMYTGRAIPDRALSPQVGPSPMPLASRTAAADSVNAPVQRVPRPVPAKTARTAHAVGSAPRQLATRDTPAPPTTLVRDELAARVAIEGNAQRMLDVIGARAGDVVLVGPISLDSARALLDADPLAIPGLAVRAVHEGRMPGYSAVVVVEQVLDSGTTLTVITARPTVFVAGEVGVAGAPQLARATPSERAGIARERAADSLGSLRPQPSPRAIPRSDTRGRGRGLSFGVRGPLAADSLAALERRLEPLRP